MLRLISVSYHKKLMESIRKSYKMVKRVRSVPKSEARRFDVLHREPRCVVGSCIQGFHGRFGRGLVVTDCLGASLQALRLPCNRRRCYILPVRSSAGRGPGADHRLGGREDSNYRPNASACGGAHPLVEHRGGDRRSHLVFAGAWRPGAPRGGHRDPYSAARISPVG